MRDYKGKLNDLINKKPLNSIKTKEENQKIVICLSS